MLTLCFMFSMTVERHPPLLRTAAAAWGDPAARLATREMVRILTVGSMEVASRRSCGPPAPSPRTSSSPADRHPLKGEYRLCTTECMWQPHSNFAMSFTRQTEVCTVTSRQTRQLFASRLRHSQQYFLGRKTFFTSPSMSCCAGHTCFRRCQALQGLSRGERHTGVWVCEHSHELARGIHSTFCGA